MTAATSGDGLPHIWHMFGDAGLPQRLLLVAKMIDRVASRHLQDEFDLSVAQWRVMAFICNAGPATASFIGEAAEADQAEISRAVKALLARGLVTRDYEPGSRKTLIIAPTAAGTALFQQVRERRQTYFTQITGTLDDAQKGALNAGLRNLAREVIVERAGHGG